MHILLSAAPGASASAARLSAEDSEGIVVVLVAILVILGVLLAVNRTSRR